MPSGSPAPIEGRCNAAIPTGFCMSRPIKGTGRCKAHGAPTRGAWTERLTKLDQATQAEVKAALEDPDQLDVRRPLALAEAVIAKTPLIPSEDTLRQVARRQVARAVGPELINEIRAILRSQETPEDMREVLRDMLAQLLEPTAADLDAAALEMHERSLKLVAIWSKRQVEAVKALEWAKVIRDQALPLLSEFGLKLSVILRKYVPEDRLASCLGEVRNAITQTLGELAAERDEKGRRK